MEWSVPGVHNDDLALGIVDGHAPFQGDLMEDGDRTREVCQRGTRDDEVISKRRM